MKLKTKLLTIIAPAALLTTAVPIALTSCGGEAQSTNSVSYSGSKTLETTASTLEIEFTLAKALSSGETVQLSYGSIHGSAIPAITKTEGTKIIVTITDSTSEALLPKTTTFDLTFKGFDASSTVLAKWESSVTGFSFTKKAA